MRATTLMLLALGTPSVMARQAWFRPKHSVSTMNDRPEDLSSESILPRRSCMVSSRVTSTGTYPVGPSPLFDGSKDLALDMSNSHQSKSSTPASTLSSPTNFAVCRFRGGACQDSNMRLFAKIGLNAALESALMLGTLYAGHSLGDKFQLANIAGLPLLQWVAIFAIIFGSSAFGSLVDGGVNAATRQALSPNAIPGDPDWYAKLKKPSWNPPGWLFPIMWLIVSKPTQAGAVSKILTSTTTTDNTGSITWKVLAVYCAHLSLGDAWNKVFFGLQCTGRGAAVISLFYGVLLTSAYLFWGVDSSAGKLLLPTCAWVTIATCLNWNIYLNN